MDWFQPTDSSAVERAGYEAARRELVIVYAGGRTYAYRRVPPATFQALIAVDAAGESVGQFVNWRIKPIYLDCREVGGGGDASVPALPRGRPDRQRQDRPGAAARR